MPGGGFLNFDNICGVLVRVLDLDYYSRMGGKGFTGMEKFGGLVVDLMLIKYFSSNSM